MWVYVIADMRRYDNFRTGVDPLPQWLNRPNSCTSRSVGRILATPTEQLVPLAHDFNVILLRPGALLEDEQ